MKVKQAKRFDEQDHRSLALWAVDCAEHVLPHFEEMYPEDDRPRKASEAEVRIESESEAIPLAGISNSKWGSDRQTLCKAQPASYRYSSF